MEEMITVFTETRHGDKPRPSRSVSTLMAWTRRMVERVNSRVLGEAKNSFAFGVNAPLEEKSEIEGSSSQLQEIVSQKLQGSFSTMTALR